MTEWWLCWILLHDTGIGKHAVFHLALPLIGREKFLYLKWEFNFCEESSTLEMKVLLLKGKFYLWGESLPLRGWGKLGLSRFWMKDWINDLLSLTNDNAGEDNVWNDDDGQDHDDNENDDDDDAWHIVAASSLRPKQTSKVPPGANLSFH